MSELLDLPLVQELANIRLNNLDALPDCSAVYLVADDANRVYYVGQSSHLQLSLKNCDRFEDFLAVASKLCWLVCDEAELVEIESDYINYYNPPLNNNIDIENIKKNTIASGMTPEQQLERYLEICTIIKELEKEKEELKQNIVAFVSDYKQQYDTNLQYKGVTFSVSERKSWEYSPTVKELEEKVKKLKKQEEKEGIAKISKVSVYPIVRGELTL